MVYDEKVHYQQSHEWARIENAIVTVGISDYAQDELGDVVYVELPEVGAELNKGDAFGVVESVKAASDLYMPLSGSIAEVNEQLRDKPELVNEAPFGEGWIVKIRITGEPDLSGLMKVDSYKEFVRGLSE